MARKKAQQEVTPESVDEMSDEEVTALMEAEEPAAGPADEGTDEPAPEAKAEPESADEPAQGEDGAEEPVDGDEDTAKAETVDFKRYDYERNRRRDAEKAREAERAEWSRRFDELLKAKQAAQPPENVDTSIPPDFPGDDDPMGQLEYLKQEFITRRQASVEQDQQREQARQEAAYRDRILNEAVMDYQSAVQADPSVADAYEAMQRSFLRELQLYGTPPQQVQAQMQNIEAQHIVYAKQNGIPIDDYIRNLAASRGWVPKQPDADPAPEPDKDERAKEEGRKRSKSLSNGGGSPGVSDSLTAEAILAMSDKEFDALMEKHGSISEALNAAS